MTRGMNVGDWAPHPETARIVTRSVGHFQSISRSTMGWQQNLRKNKEKMQNRSRIVFDGPRKQGSFEVSSVPCTSGKPLSHWGSFWGNPASVREAEKGFLLAGVFLLLARLRASKLACPHNIEKTSGVFIRGSIHRITGAVRIQPGLHPTVNFGIHRSPIRRIYVPIRSSQSHHVDTIGSTTILPDPWVIESCEGGQNTYAQTTPSDTRNRWGQQKFTRATLSSSLFLTMNRAALRRRSCSGYRSGGFRRGFPSEL